MTPLNVEKEKQNKHAFIAQVNILIQKGDHGYNILTKSPKMTKFVRKRNFKNGSNVSNNFDIVKGSVVNF